MMENNFVSRVATPPYTMYDNQLIQKETIFKSANQKLCYMYLVSYANCSRIFPSMESIATAICATTRTAMTVIQQLEEIGLIEVIRTSGKSNQYILNDYFEVELATRENFSPVKNFHETSEKISLVPVKKFHTKTNNLKLKNKNKISSRDSINNSLKDKYSKAPFDEVKEQMLGDETLVITTDKQYKSMLEYRLKNWKPTQPKKKKVIRSEIVPDWLTDKVEEPKRPEINPEEFEEQKSALFNRIRSYKENNS